VNDNSNVNLLESWVSFKSVDNSSLISLRSELSPNLTNELKFQFQTVSREYELSPDLPKENIPRAIVTVSSVIPTATNPNATQTRTVQFGGQRFGTEYAKNLTLQLANTSYFAERKFEL